MVVATNKTVLWYRREATESRWMIRQRNRMRPRRHWVLGVLDSVAWSIALGMTAAIRYEFQWPNRTVVGMAVLTVVASLAMLAGGLFTGVHNGRFVIGSMDDVVGVARTFGLATIAVTFADLWFVPRILPVLAAVVAGFVALVIALVPRLALLLAVDSTGSTSPEGSRRLMVFGAGEAGTQIVSSLLRERHSQFLPVALIDDDPAKSNRSIGGIRVMGTRADIPRIAQLLRVDTLLVAVPSAQPEVKVAIASLAAAAGLELRILPAVHELVDLMSVHDIREVSEADLLGRPQVEIDLDAIAAYLSGRKVLVTGAGGSIGSEICRQVRRFDPSELIMLDRDESALHALELNLGGRALLTSRNLVVADIRDACRVREVFAEHRPEVVFHAAALKHLPLLELHPGEGVKTNIGGTKNLLAAALEFGVNRFVNISTDKAADPVSVLGSTKLVAERLTADASLRTNGTYVSVRFGNVLGSRGSVLPTFRKQIENGGPVTVTHPDVTRYFMTTEEAVRLVFQAAAIGSAGEVLILDMGAPVRIDDLARRLIGRAGRPIDIHYTGLRPGEKLHERLVGLDEIAAPRGHPLVFHAAVPPLTAEALQPLRAADLRDYPEVREVLVSGDVSVSTGVV